MYSIQITASAIKDYRKIPDREAKRINTVIDALAANPRPTGCKKLEGRDAFRVRVGDYRIIYEITDKILTVYVIRIRHRKDVYK